MKYTSSLSKSTECFILILLSLILFFILGFASSSLMASVRQDMHYEEIDFPKQWAKLQPILHQRLHQKKAKMKLSQNEVQTFKKFLSTLTKPTPALLKLQTVLPKTTLELLRAIHERNLPIPEAEDMAAYLYHFVQQQNFQNVSAFDENTSHIIGREWQQIDYSGEGMTWQGQRRKYLPYGISHFKSKDNLIKFFKVESTLPYFKKIYRSKP